ncbi:MAG: hypothetical protein ACQZ3N_02590 [cyanobacterium endosymbiont of Rhopalodia yunnanensis]
MDFTSTFLKQVILRNINLSNVF